MPDKNLLVQCDFCESFLSNSGNAVQDRMLAASFLNRQQADSAARKASWMVVEARMHVCRKCQRVPKQEILQRTAFAGGNQ